MLDTELRKSISSSIYATLCGEESAKQQVEGQAGKLGNTPRMNFSPAESLDSSLTLVSMGTVIEVSWGSFVAGKFSFPHLL